MNKQIAISIGLICLMLAPGCSHKSEKKFRLVPSSESGIAFLNNLHETVDFNLFNYMYFYNGGGVAVGDINGDDLIDIYFTSNQESNKLYLNRGNLRFEDITEVAGVSGLDSWTTGVTMADVNGDGKLDIYVCYVGDYLNFKGKNQLYINEGVNEQGIPQFVDRANEYGLDLVGFSTQAVFFDYDNDGDLDMFMLNHSLHQNGTFGRVSSLRYENHPTAGDKLLRNDNGKFIDVTRESGIYSSVLGYGLGVVVSDINLDGWLDIYVGNDFHENDYLYINKGDGTFEERLEQSMNHTSRYTMGVDFADFNNDGFPDLIAMDMLPATYKNLKSSAAEDPYDTYEFKIGFGYNEQYTRNVLQLNNQDGTFSEIGLFAGVHATDWSWSTLFADFNLDGNKDIFVSNGILRRSNDLDYINFISADSIQKRLQDKLNERELNYLQRIPKVKIQNFLFVNNNDSTFTDVAASWGLDHSTYSNGAAYADLDNDGDLDLVINNINEVAYVYENRTINNSGGNNKSNFIRIALEGTQQNVNGIGAKVFLYAGKQLQMQECMLTRGYQSSVDARLIFGLGSADRIDSLLIIWSDGSYQVVKEVKSNQNILLKQIDAKGKFNYKNFTDSKKLFKEGGDLLQNAYKHKENKYIEFDREGLIPFMLSAEGPAVAIGDINSDGLDDIFLGGAKWQPGEVFIQTNSGQFIRINQPLLESDSTFEDVNALFFDADGDKDLDLFVVSGGNEFTGKSKYMKPRLYINDGKGKFNQYGNLPDLFLTGSVVTASDFDRDGDMDIFLGARAIPWKYGIPPDSYLLVNDGNGNYTDGTSQMAPELLAFGFVKDATWADIDNDGDDDLLVAAEWMPLTIFYNSNGVLKAQTGKGIEYLTGLWNTIETGDFDQDGDLDIVVGNHGLNSKLKADRSAPIRMYVNDFDNNETTEQLVTHVINGIEYPFNTRDELTKQIPSLKKKYLSYQKFSEARFIDLFSKDVIQNSKVYTANMLESMYIENKGKGIFEAKPLPKAVQFSTIHSIFINDFNKDGNFDMLIGGNFFRSNIQLGRYDASYGNLLLGDGKGNFRCIPARESGFSITGEVRKILPVKINGKHMYIVVRNNNTVKFFDINTTE